MYKRTYSNISFHLLKLWPESLLQNAFQNTPKVTQFLGEKEYFLGVFGTLKVIPSHDFFFVGMALSRSDSGS